MSGAPYCVTFYYPMQQLTHRFEKKNGIFLTALTFLKVCKDLSEGIDANIILDQVESSFQTETLAFLS